MTPTFQYDDTNYPPLTQFATDSDSDTITDTDTDSEKYDWKT